MNYERIYNELVAHAQQQPTPSIKEVHHILPRSMGGGDEPSNLVSFTPRQHFIAHRLLAKFTTGKDKHKMLKAIMFMSNVKGADNSRGYSNVRKEFLSNNRMYRAEEVGAPDLYLPLLPFKDLFKGSKPTITRGYLDKKGINTLQLSKYGAQGRAVNFCLSVALLGYKGFTKGRKSINIKLLLDKQWITVDTSGKNHLYTFTQEFIDLADKLLFTKPKGVKINTLLMSEGKGKRMGNLRDAITKWNLSNPLKLIQLKCDSEAWVKKVNGWKGDIPEEVLLEVDNYNS